MGEPARYLALGDSYTIGEGVPATDRWPEQLVRTVQADGRAIASPTVVATTGWTTDELAGGLAAARLTPPYDLVSLLIGVNNQYRSRPLAEYAAQFRELLELAIGFAGGVAERVLVVSIPDWGVTRFAAGSGRDRHAIASAIDAFNSAAARHAETAGARFVDITDLTRRYPDELVADGLHPDATQYARWVERIAPVVTRVLDGPARNRAAI